MAVRRAGEGAVVERMAWEERCRREWLDGCGDKVQSWTVEQRCRRTWGTSVLAISFRSIGSRILAQPPHQKQRVRRWLVSFPFF
jgi:hypothetical protein